MYQKRGAEFHTLLIDTYTAQATVGDIMKGQTNHKNLESTDSALLVFGNGDGGGGPLAKMLENVRHFRHDYFDNAY